MREYIVSITGKIEVEKLQKLKNGIKIKGVRYKGIKVSFLKRNKNSAQIKMQLIEGKNREIR